MQNHLAVVVGFIGKLPYAGMALFNLHYIAGLRELGYRIHYVEKMDSQWDCYDPTIDAMTGDPSYALGYLANLLPCFGLHKDQYSFVDANNDCHGSDWNTLRNVLDEADFVFTLATPTWFDELDRCPERAFIDGDPLFTQAAMLEGAEPYVSVSTRYDILFSYGSRIGMPDCRIPGAGRSWIPTRPVVATNIWEVQPANCDLAPVTALLHWAAGKDVYFEGCVYGHKDRELERFIDLPKRTARPFTIAVGGPAPKATLREHGWSLVNPLEVTGTIEAYKKFIAASRADFGVAKHAYVASRSGWFSDRSTCYLAAGRPVLHQDTGFTEWLPTGEGILPFSNVDEVVEALRRLDADYEMHARAARRIAEEHFEAAKVIGRMLDDAGYR